MRHNIVIRSFRLTGKRKALRPSFYPLYSCREKRGEKKKNNDIELSPVLMCSLYSKFNRLSKQGDVAYTTAPSKNRRILIVQTAALTNNLGSSWRDKRLDSSMDCSDNMDSSAAISCSKQWRCHLLSILVFDRMRSVDRWHGYLATSHWENHRQVARVDWVRTSG